MDGVMLKVRLEDGNQAEDMLSVLFRGIGVRKVDFEVPTLWVGLMCLGIGLVAYAVSMLVSWRIRKITPYNLIVE